MEEGLAEADKVKVVLVLEILIVACYNLLNSSHSARRVTSANDVAK